MRKRRTAACGLLLAFLLTACGGEKNMQPEDFSAASAKSDRQAILESVEIDGETSLKPQETGGREQMSSLSDNGGYAGEILTDSAVPPRQLEITAEDGSVIKFTLNDSAAANDLYDQLPFNVPAENYGTNEKIFYPPEELNTFGAPPAQGPAGTLAYYAPWGNVAIFYGECGGASGLYELGEAVSGAEFIPGLTGQLNVEAAGTADPPLKVPEQTAASSQAESTDRSLEEDSVVKMNVQIENSAFTAVLEKNPAAEALMELLENGPLVIRMQDYSGFEKVGSLGNDLPASDSRMTTQSGDIVLYNGNQVVIFYGSNTWSYTKLGKIEDLSGWEAALGSGDVTVTFSISR